MSRARRRAALVALPLWIGSTWLGPRAVAAPADDRVVLIFRVQGVSFEELLRAPEMRALARAGGAGLLSYRGAVLARIRSPGPPAEPVGAVREFQFSDVSPSELRSVAATIRTDVLSSGASQVLAVVTSFIPSDAMVEAKDQLHPIIVAEGDPATLFPDAGPMHALTSDSTHRDGVVVDADLGPTIRGFLGSWATSDVGSAIRFVEGPPPFDLHERYLAMRRMSVPIQTAAGLYVTIAGLFGIGLLALGRRAPRALVWTAAWLALSVSALAVGLLLAGHLPTLSYGTVVPFVIGTAAVGTLAFAPLVRLDVLLPPAAIGAAVLAAFVVEAALGWTAALTPFLGGSELDGGRFYGMPNVFIGLLLGASLYVAVRLPPIAGFALLAAAGLFAGLPWTGVNLGGAFTLFAAAGLWLSIRRSGRIAIRELGITAGVTLVGMAIVLLAHRYLTTTPTHATRFIEQGGGLGHYVRTYADRLLVGWRLIERNPFALVPVLGLPTVLAIALRPPEAIRTALAARPVWRDAVLVAVLGGVVAYLANDSGAAAAGLAFGLGLGGLLYVSLAERARKMEGS